MKKNFTLGLIFIFALSFSLLLPVSFCLADDAGYETSNVDTSAPEEGYKTDMPADNISAALDDNQTVASENVSTPAEQVEAKTGSEDAD